MREKPAPENHQNQHQQSQSQSQSSQSFDGATPGVDVKRVLSALNTEQLKAVEHDPSIPLQILAGPGSGKTKVLISRIVQLTLSYNISPSSICAVTFTNKAANEMRERLTSILGKQMTKSLQMGTFHSLCAKFLRIYPHKVGLKTNFTICDADESKKLISALLKPYKEALADSDIALTEGRVASAISKAKAKGYSATDYAKETLISLRTAIKGKFSSDHNIEDNRSVEQIIAEVYTGYQQVLSQNNALDFDDLLIYGVQLFSQHRDTVLWCQHILVDEFQDTNTMQYELMKSIGIRRCVTIVGDPDQSIYGWRSAEVVNLSRMHQDFPNTQQIFLEQNYRSTAAILRASMAIVSEDKKRVRKSLRTSNALGFSPVVAEFETEKEEAAFIAFEIKRCVANMGKTLRWGDFVVLLRFNALSRPIESALQKEGIPCRILGGHKFFERMEVKDILSYLQLVDNPAFDPAFIRAVKAPTRGVGDKTLSEIATRAAHQKISQLQLAENIHDSKAPDIKPSIKRKIMPFIQVIRAIRKMDASNVTPSEMIRKLVRLVEYEDYLKKTQQDWESRWENVQELITFASEVEAEITSIDQPSMPAHEDAQEAHKGSNQQSTLRSFLQASMLSSEGDNQSEEQSKEKVTISTCHAAKGLEWPVVIIPSVDQDTFPFYRTEDVEEERRLLYVGCTRAQSLLYLSYSRQRQVAGKTKQKKLSDFISIVRNKNQGHFSTDIPRFLSQDRAVISTILGRNVPDEQEVAKNLAELESTCGNRLQSTYQNANGTFSALSLMGVKINNEHESAVRYAAPDVLATLSATFMKDYKKPAFGNASGQSSRSTAFQTSFTSASSVAQNLPTISDSGSASASYFPQDEKRGPNSRPQEYSRQGPSKPMIPSSDRQLNLGQEWLTSNHCRSGALKERNEDIFGSMPRSDVTRPHHVITASPKSPSHLPNAASMQKFARPLLHSSSSNRSADISSGSVKDNTHSSQKKENGPNSGIAPGARCAESDKRATAAQVPGQQSLGWNNSRPRPHESCTPRSGHLKGPTAENPSDGGTLAARTAVVPPGASQQGVNTALISPAQRPGAPETSHVDNQAAPHTAVKRRLGMGRTTTGYSNKKFKRPV